MLVRLRHTNIQERHMQKNLIALALLIAVLVMFSTAAPTRSV